MTTISQQLNQLQTDKQTLVDNLVAKGIDATGDETFTSLVPKVANIKGDTGLVSFSDFDENGFPHKAVIIKHYKTTSKNIPPYLLYGSSNNDSYYNWLEEIVLPDDTLSLGSYCFAYLKKLNKITIPEGVTTISEACFFGSGNENTVVNLPSNLTTISQDAFDYFKGTQELILPDTIKTISTNAFRNSTLTIKKLPASLTTLGTYCFNGSPNVDIKEFPEGLTSIPSYYCGSKTELTCKGNITLVARGSFEGKSSFGKLIFEGNTSVPSLAYANEFTRTLIGTGTGYIYVPDDLVDSFKSATNWSAYASQIKGISELE